MCKPISGRDTDKPPPPHQQLHNLLHAVQGPLHAIKLSALLRRRCKISVEKNDQKH